MSEARWPPTRVEVVLAAGVAAAGLAELWVPFSWRQGSGSQWSSSVVACLVSLSLLWVRRVPLVLGSVRLGVDHLVDATGAALPLVAGRDPWPVLAATGGHPTTCFGEWGAGGFRPLSVVVDDRWVSCG